MREQPSSGRDTSAADVDGIESPAGPQDHHESVGERQGRQPAPSKSSAAQGRELDGLRKLYGQKFNAIGAALGHATEAQDKFEAGDVDAAMREVEKVVSILVDA